MEVYEIAILVAGGIGAIVAIAHGILMQKYMIVPILADASQTQTTRRLVPLLLHFSTVCWFLGGIGLMATHFISNHFVTLTTLLFVGSFYAFGAIGNLWGTRGRHPGWVLLAIAVALIIYAFLRMTANI